MTVERGRVLWFESTFRFAGKVKISFGIREIGSSTRVENFQDSCVPGLSHRRRAGCDGHVFHVLLHPVGQGRHGREAGLAGIVNLHVPADGAFAVAGVGTVDVGLGFVQHGFRIGLVVAEVHTGLRGVHVQCELVAQVGGLGIVFPVPADGVLDAAVLVVVGFDLGLHAAAGRGAFLSGDLHPVGAGMQVVEQVGSVRASLHRPVWA